MNKREKLSKAGALLAAAGVSACCWLPLLLAALGAGAGGIGAFFEPLRPYLMVVTAAMLGTAFYFTYRRPAACAADGACATAGRSRRGKITLWAVAALAAVSFAFPYWSERRLRTANAAASATAGPPALEIPVSGITCAACGLKIRDAVGALPGVTAVKVEPEPGKVSVWTERAVDPARVADAIRAAGYEPGAPVTRRASAAAPAATRTAYVEVRGMVKELGIT